MRKARSATKVKAKQRKRTTGVNLTERCWDAITKLADINRRSNSAELEHAFYSYYDAMRRHLQEARQIQLPKWDLEGEEFETVDVEVNDIVLR